MAFVAVSAALLALVANGVDAVYPPRRVTRPRTEIPAVAGPVNSTLINRPDPSKELVFLGGKVQSEAPIVTAVFWGKNWANTTFQGDIVQGVDDFFNGWSKSKRATTLTEFTDKDGRPVSDHITYTGHVFNYTDSQPGSQYYAILDTVCAAGGSNIDPKGNNYFPVFVDFPVSNAPGKLSYCGWHTYDYCLNGRGVRGAAVTNPSSTPAGAQLVQFAFHWHMDSPACDAQDTETGNSMSLASLVSVAAHELEEYMTDPITEDAPYGGYQAPDGNENADRCAWTFSREYITLANGRKFKIQDEWSNYAYRAGLGTPARMDGARGCIPQWPLDD